MKYYGKVSALFFLALSFTIAQAASGQPSAQPTAASGVQQAEPPPHVDAEPNPGDRQLENKIMDDLKQDPHMAYSKGQRACHLQGSTSYGNSTDQNCKGPGCSDCLGARRQAEDHEQDQGEFEHSPGPGILRFSQRSKG